MPRTKFKRRTIKIVAVLCCFVLLLGISTTFFLARSPKKAEAAWYNSAWSYRKQFVVNNSYVSAINGTTLTDFPVLVDVTDPDIRYTGSGGNVALTSGDDIVFTASNGSTLLNYEIEQYTSASGSLQAWVNMASLSPSGSYSFYMYYGNSSAPANTTLNAKNSWNSNYLGVWHLNDNAANKTVDDATNSFNGTNVANTSTKTVAGRVAKGLNYNGSNDATTMGTSSSLGATTNYTMSAWVKATTWANNAPIFKKDVDFIFRYNTGGGCNTGLLEMIFWTASNQLRCTEASAPSTGGWHYLAATIVAGDVGGIYVDGVRTNGTIATNGTGTRVLTNVFQVGGDASHGEWYTGVMDELRVQNNAASDDWINTTYNSIQFPGSFLIILGQEFNPAPAPPSVPTLIYPEAGGTDVSIIPQFQLRSSDVNGDYLKYYLQVFSGGTCTTLVSTADMSGGGGGTGWVNKDANSSTAYFGGVGINDSSIALYQYPPALLPNTTYSWLAKAIDPAGSNTYGTTSACQSFTTGTSEVQIKGGTNINGGTDIL